MTSSAHSMPRRRGFPRLLGLGTAAAVAALAVVLLVTHPWTAADASTASARSAAQRGGAAAGGAKYGGLPKWLPKTSTPVNRVVTATVAKPAVAIQGDAVSVHLGGGRVLATAVGPQVPEAHRPAALETTPCTFVVTLASASGSVPITRRAFTVTDGLGRLHHPTVSAMGGGAPPARVPDGGTVSVKVHGVLPTGDGALGWAPAGGGPIVSWDYVAEVE